MRRYPGDAESSPDAELPDRIHYLLPDGCGDITDMWAREAKTGKVEKKILDLLQAWSKEPQAASLPKMLFLPKAISAVDLAERLRVPKWLLIAVLMEMSRVTKGQSMIDSYLGKSLLDFEIARQVCNVFGVTACPEEKTGLL